MSAFWPIAACGDRQESAKNGLAQKPKNQKGSHIRKPLPAIFHSGDYHAVFFFLLLEKSTGNRCHITCRQTVTIKTLIRWATEKLGLLHRVFYYGGGEVSVRPMLGMLGGAALCSVMLIPASADYRRGGHEGGEWKDEYRDGPCKVKIESKDDQYKEEVKCPDGRGANWRRGEWKDEFWERGCKVKIEAKRDEYKKEIKCDDDD
ncbi:hypothetical protein [Pseudomonas sp. BF-R-24]|uniref:hypothetical protein n=1 Tax=Pseudomonas sp. BF-R-24 TaxID=2832386 RepID=UPI001CBDD750|nr:hypothetical protein [Pseudomonas sp. BF-R-24]